MKRPLQLISILFVSTSLGGCTSAAQRVAEQQDLERSIRKTSNPDAVKGCSFIMNLRPDGLHNTPEAQAASLVIPKQGVSWVVFDRSGSYELYACSHKTPQNEQATAPPTPIPVPVEATATPAQPEAKPDTVTREQPQAKIEPPEPKRNVSKTRVTNNPEAVKGCKFLESFVEYHKVSRFQEDVVRAGGNLGYIVATNQDGDVIGESYLCSEEAKP
jgi:hypothetical protein